MFTRRRLCALAAFSLLVVAGCQSSTAPATPPDANSRQAISIRGNDGTTVAFFIPTDNPDKPMALTGDGSPVCPECREAAVKYFRTGVLDPKCSRTGATRTLVIMRDASTGHQYRGRSFVTGMDQ